MKIFSKSALSTTTCLATVALSMFGTATAAQAQDAAAANVTSECTDANKNNVCDDQETTAIVVTGSRIARPNLESTVPIASIGGEEFVKAGENNIGESLNDLPQLRSTFAQTNPGLGIGIAGLNLLDLRGLGTQRTLVLVNGRRHVPADILNNAVSPDVNSIPNDLIERVDIVTGGNSAVYGSDAIAGVVNFVLRKSYDGIQLRATAGFSEPGFGGNQYVSGMYGKNFADGAGNITLHAEYAHQDRVYASDMPWLRSQDGFFFNDSDTGGLAGNSDGVPDNVFMRDARSSTINRYGLIPINQRIGNPVCGSATIATNGSPTTSPTATSFNCTYIFDNAGNLTPQTGTRIGTSMNPTFLGGNGQTGREDKLLSVNPKMDRVNLNLLSHYSFSDAFEVFVEGKWNRVHTRGSNAGPSFIQGTQSQFDFRERTRLDNPFLTSAQRATIASAITTSGCNTSLTVTCPATGNLTAADVAAINAGTYRFVIARHLADSGIRDEDFTRDTWRVVGGFRGTFNDDWRYEVSANYGKFTEKTTTYGYVDRQRFALAMDAGRNPLTGQIQCRSQFDPTAAVTLQRGDLSAAQNTANAARLAADIAACVPYNPFGGLDNSASAKYFTYNATHQAGLDQLVLNAFVSGDTSGFFNLPGGPVSFAVGAEYRREKAFYREDQFVQGGYTNAVVIPDFVPDPFEVKEAFAELQVPLLKDTPFFNELSLSGAARVAQYQGGTGTVWAYNGGADWSPFEGLRFRGNYARAVRAPNVSETGFPLVPNFAPGFVDPCSPGSINNGTSSRAANCQADLGALLTNLTNTSYSLPVLSGSNPNLQAEKSDSYTVGAVFTPTFVPGLSVSVDYYNIRVKGIISSLSAQQIVNLCYDQPSLTNIFCSSFSRYRGTGTSPGGYQPGQVLENTVVQAPLNFAKRERQGIDTQITYRTDLGGAKLYTNLIYTHNFKISNYENPTIPTFENQILSELGDPKDEFRWDTDLTFNKVTFGYRMRYIGPMYTSTYEAFNELPTACLPTGCPPTNADVIDVQQYPAVFYHDFRLEFNLGRDESGKDFQFYVGVNNALNTHPPYGLTGTTVGSAIYDYRGRNWYTGVRARF